MTYESEQPRAGATALHEMGEMGAHGEDGQIWLPRSRYTRSQARTWYADFTGVRWIDANVYARYMVYDPSHPGAAEYDGEYWVECAKDHPGAFPVWRCE